MKKNIAPVAALGLALALALALIIIANISLSGIRLDLTESGLFTLSEGTVNILDALEEPVSLDFYFSKKTPGRLPPADELRHTGARSAGRVRR